MAALAHTTGCDADANAIMAAVSALPGWALQDAEFRRHIHLGVAMLRFLGREYADDSQFSNAYEAACVPYACDQF